MKNYCKSMNCFIVAFYFPSPEAVMIFNDMLVRIRARFGEIDIYVGMNPGPSVNEGIAVAKKHNVYYGVCIDELICKRDPSGYQLALKLLKDSGRQYDLYWFIHGKALSHGRHEEREFIFQDFLINKIKIEKLFRDYQYVGSYGDMLMQIATAKEGVSLECQSPTACGLSLDRYYYFPPISLFEFFYAKTYYVIRGEIINRFIDGCRYEFFTSQLNFRPGKPTDIYFFERDFIRVVDRMGFLILARCVISLSDMRWGNVDVYQQYLDEIQLWVVNNNTKVSDYREAVNLVKGWRRN